MRRFSFPSPYMIFVAVASVFLFVEWIAKQNLLPQVKLPGFEYDSVGSFMFLGFIGFSALISLKTAAYFLVIAWFAEFCKVNQQYPLLKILADVFYSPQSWVISHFQNTFVPAEHLGLFLTFLIYMLLAYIIAKEHEQKVRVVWSPERYLHV